MKARVYVVDDNEGVTQSLQWLIESMGYEVATYTSAQQFLSELVDDRPSCLILDVRMPEIAGPELQQLLINKGVKIPIIFITAHGDIHTAVRVMKDGAVDFLTKPASGQMLLEAVNKAVRLDFERHHLEEQSAAVLEKFNTLTPREREVVFLVVQGKLTKSIASQLGLSQRTVEMHRANIMKKMDVCNQVELSYLVMKNQLIEQ